MLAVLPSTYLSSPPLSSSLLHDPFLYHRLPFVEVGGVQDNERVGLDLSWPSSGLGSYNPLRLSLRCSPSHDVYIVSASTPGLPASAIKLELVGSDTLTFTIDESRGLKDVGESTSPISHSHLQQSLRLPGPVDPSRIRIVYRDGLLTVYAPPADETSGGLEDEPEVAALQAEAQQARLKYLALLDQLRVAKHQADEAEHRVRSARKAAAAARSKRRVQLSVGGEREPPTTQTLVDVKPASPQPPVALATDSSPTATGATAEVTDSAQ